NPSLGAGTLPDLIALIKSKPGQLSYGTSGASTPHHLFMEMFLKMIGGKAQHVPYRGSVPALTDVVSGEIQIMMVDLAIALQLIKEGKVKAYGVTSPTRVKSAPEIPTLAEAGLPGYAARGWFSVVARAGTPRPIVDRLNGILMSYLQRPDVNDRMQAVAIDVLTSTPDELAQFIPAEIAKWAQVRSEEHTSELQSLTNLVCRLLLEKKKTKNPIGAKEENESSLAEYIGAITKAIK